jgi:hypothetical protein
MTDEAMSKRRDVTATRTGILKRADQKRRGEAILSIWGTAAPLAKAVCHRTRPRVCNPVVSARLTSP